jgi:hypothetical protein
MLQHFVYAADTKKVELFTNTLERFTLLPLSSMYVSTFCLYGIIVYSSHPLWSTAVLLIQYTSYHSSTAH